MHPAVVAPWRAPLSDLQHSLATFGIVVAGLALVAMLVRTWTVRGEVSGRYRPAISASLGVLSVAAVSYAVIYLKFDSGYRWNGSMWIPGVNAAAAWSTRYLDWAITVPLLVVELLAVSALRGRTLSRVRTGGVTAAFLMIATGYLGGVAISGGESFTALLTWGLVSSAFFTVLYVLVLITVLRSLPALPTVARGSYRAAMLLLMATWFVYPIVFGLQGLTSGGAATTTAVLLLSTADVTAKVGFGLLLHRVAKLRTAFDVQAGIEPHPETLWIDGVRQSDAVLPSALEEDLRSSAPLQPASDERVG